MEVVRHLLAVLVLQLSHLPGGDRRPTVGDETFRRFRQAVETGFTRTRRLHPLLPPPHRRDPGRFPDPGPAHGRAADG
ncbi:hypothetical protein [Kitasatospora cineracea]|uniref:hypothetical protein n=1 Tax=Kitasatospora cineracea TaxID=88074 RepID=UPI00369C7E7C